MTRRQQLIQQMREALHMLQCSTRYEDEEVVFTIADTEFDFTGEDLNNTIPDNLKCHL